MHTLESILGKMLLGEIIVGNDTYNVCYIYPFGEQ